MDGTSQPAMDVETPVRAGENLDLDWASNPTLDFLYREVLSAILIDGARVEPVAEVSIGGGRATFERRNYSFELANARDRIVTTQSNHLRATLAVGRFIWMMAGNDRLDDVRFYQSRGVAGPRTDGVGRFSEDGLSISGSNYGQRLFRPRPGIDQVQACIELIRADPNTRRAAMTVYQPEDAGRDSVDIPCTFGVLLGPRDGALHQTVVMRSNNAWMLLPYNIFEFSLLGEVIASETGLDFGSYHHFAISMHLYEADVEKARKAVSEPSVVLEPFDEMPRGSLEKVRQLCTWESRVRHTSAGFGKRDRDREVKELVSLGRFWEAFGRVVLAKAFINNKKFDLAQQVAEPTRGPLGQLLRLEMAEIAESPGALQPQLELRDSPIPPLSEEVLERMHTDRQARLEAEKTTAHFYLMMIGQNLSETPGPAER